MREDDDDTGKKKRKKKELGDTVTDTVHSPPLDEH